MVMKLLSLGTAIKTMREKTMKKLLGISIVAMLAVTPMMANAAGQAIPATPQTGNTYYAAAVASEGTSKIATTSYVKGAYNAIQTELNGIATDIDVTTDGTHIHASKSVAENLAELDTAVVANDTKIGAITTLQNSNTFDTGETHNDVVSAIISTKTEANTTKTLVGVDSAADLNTIFDGDTSINTVGQALQALKSANDSTDGKAIAVYSDWNGGETPYRAAGDYVQLSATDALDTVGIKPNN